jgi:hypothetical protein
VLILAVVVPAAVMSPYIGDVITRGSGSHYTFYVRRHYCCSCHYCCRCHYYYYYLYPPSATTTAVDKIDIAAGSSLYTSSDTSSASRAYILLILMEIVALGEYKEAGYFVPRTSWIA